ncbi:hypothetical protein ACXZ9C_11600 [Streptococcus agalactiae]
MVVALVVGVGWSVVSSHRSIVTSSIIVVDVVVVGLVWHSSLVSIGSCWLSSLSGSSSIVGSSSS